MKKLKDLLSEVSGTKKPDIIGSGSDPWDYAYDKQTQTWWARKKTQDTYVDLSKSLTPDKYAKAKAILDKQYDSKFANLAGSDDKPKPENEDNKALTDAQKIILDVVSSIEDIIQNNPEKYFKSFSGAINDDESGAQRWWIAHYNNNLNKKLMLAISKSNNNKIIIANQEAIRALAISFRNAIIDSKITTISTVFKLPITDPITKKTEIHKFTWSYL